MTALEQHVSVLPEPVPSTETAVLEVQVRWGRHPLEVLHFAHGAPVTLGPTGDIRLVDDENVRVTRPLFTRQGTQHVLHVPPGFTATMHPGGLPTDVAHEGVALSPEDHGELQFHDLTLAWRFNEPRRRVPPSLLGNMDHLFVNTLLACIWLGVCLVSVFTLMPRNAQVLEEELTQTRNTFSRLVMTPPTRRPNEFLRKLNPGSSTPTRPHRMAATLVAPQGRESARSRRSHDEKVVARALGSMFGGSAAHAVLGAMDNHELENALGHLKGTQVGVAHGFGAVDTRGAIPGETGATSTYASGEIVTRGRAGGNPRYADVGGGMWKKHEEAPVEVDGQGPEIFGPLDKQVIRRVIQEHHAQIRYCYELELTRSPGLSGRVLMRFVIGATGRVQRANVEETSLRNVAVESCMADKVQGWTFPPLKGGGTAVVSYPFMFKQAG